jgi:predicted O-methyltransferase YrrM
MSAQRFQEQLYSIVRDAQPVVAVETGFSGGLSAMHILAAMDVNEKGTLYSVECFTNQAIFHPRLKFIRGMSQDQMLKIYLKSGPWDLFLHDSDHEVGCTTFEYELAWAFLRPGGVMLTDDYEWGNPIHYAWKKFLDRHGVGDVTTIGSAQYCSKPQNAPMPSSHVDWATQQFSLAAKLSADACKQYQAA